MVVVRYLLWLFGILAAQWIFLADLPLSAYGNPYLYLWFFLWLPYGMNRAGLYALAFAVGSLMDALEQSGGAHTVATLILVLAKPYVENAFIGYRKSDNDESLANLSLGAFLTPALVLVALHHLILFTMEQYSFFPLGQLSLRTLVSSLLTTLLIAIAHGLFSKRYAS